MIKIALAAIVLGFKLAVLFARRCYWQVRVWFAVRELERNIRR